MQISKEKHFNSAFSEYLGQLQQLVRRYESARILELGGGRTPSFSLSDLPESVASYTVNDVSEEELKLASDEYDKACFDVSGDVSDFAGQFDIVFSRTLAEHVKNGRAMHQNILSLLRPGGVAFHMVPTLYAPPFVINKLLPETLSRNILIKFFPERRSEIPKFPAYYSWCFGNRAKMQRLLRGLGYSEVQIRTFYGHDYFRAVPGIREVDRALSALAAKRDWSSYGSYAHLIAYK